MKNLLLTFLLISIAQLGISQTTWAIDKGHSGIRFTVTHMVITKIDGSFTDFDATVVSNSEDFSGAEIEFTAKTASINTGNERRDNHLRSDDFFSAEMYPEIKFAGRIMKQGDEYKAVGDLTLKGNTKPVAFDVEYNGQIPGRNGKKAGFQLTGTIDRFDYGLTWDRALETGSLVVGKEVEITCNVQLNEVVPEGGE